MKVIKEKIHNLIWGVDIKQMPWWMSAVVSVIRFIHIMIIDFTDGQLNLRAMSLVFTTVLSIVPLFAVSFSVMAAFGLRTQMEPMLLNYLAPLGAQGQEIANNITSFVNNINIKGLGAIGLITLFLIIIRLINKIELAFNYTWRVQQTGSLIRRLANYLLVIVFGPILVLGALAITGTVLNTTVAQAIISVEPFGTLLSFASKLVPYLLVIVAFTFTYLFIPNAKVRVIPALVGGIAAGILWQTVGWVFATAVSTSMTANYTAIYSGFAFLFVFMIWLWWSWLILLVGSSVAFYRQYPEYLFVNTLTLVLTNRQREELALIIMTNIGQRFYSNTCPVSANDLVEILQLPKQSIERVLNLFEERKILTKVDDEDPMYTPARPLEELSLKEVIDCVREPEPGNVLQTSIEHQNSKIIQYIDSIDSKIDEIMGNKMLKEVILETMQNEDENGSAAITPIKIAERNKN